MGPIYSHSWDPGTQPGCARAGGLPGSQRDAEVTQQGPGSRRAQNHPEPKLHQDIGVRAAGPMQPDQRSPALLKTATASD